ncbi:MAG: hypothetical protein EZS28_040693 [Streblomastix strix]|uniref:Uncharacterized protein n=1 Tax=Streblomastix strix TaxID=222440 RepID=A0A5J4U0U4_9EUKA|nr:MAG: hypothetical protein EZS28_040693 [Streblomastix strix]
MPAAICNLCRGAKNNKLKADMAVMGVLFLASIWQNFFAAIKTMYMFETATNEYSFWEGFDYALSHLGIDEQKRMELINKTEQENGIKRPNEHLYTTAVELHAFMMFATINSFNISRKTYTTIAGYEDAEKEFFSDKYQDSIFSKVKAETEPSEYDGVKKSVEELIKRYPLFTEVPLNMKKFQALHKNLQEDKIQALLDWYKSFEKKSNAQVFLEMLTDLLHCRFIIILVFFYPEEELSLARLAYAFCDTYQSL